MVRCGALMLRRAHGVLRDAPLRLCAVDIEEKGVVLRLTIAESVGFGDQIDKSIAHKAIAEYIDARHAEYLSSDMLIKRPMASMRRDSRIHVCLYFLRPTGHSLRSIDVVAMKYARGARALVAQSGDRSSQRRRCVTDRELMTRVNLVPVIGKADCLTRTELAVFKQSIRDDLERNGISIFQVVTEGNECQLNDAMPYAIVASRRDLLLGGQKVRARQYPWGIVEVENEAHSDFAHLRDMLLRKCTMELISRTHDVHYEAYRRKTLTSQGYVASDGRSVVELLEIKSREMAKQFQKARLPPLPARGTRAPSRAELAAGERYSRHIYEEGVGEAR